MSWVRERIVKPYQSYAPKALGGKRSRKWPSTRKAFIKEFGWCAMCGKKKKLQVHHIEDFSTKPELELEFTNLITLCMGTLKCHLLCGHLGNWKSINPNVTEDSAKWFNKIKNRRK